MILYLRNMGVNQLLFILLCAAAAHINARESSGNISSFFQSLQFQSASNLVNASDDIYQYPSILSVLGVREGMVPVDITASFSTQALLNDLQLNGCEVQATYAHLVSARCPIANVTKLGDLSTVNFVNPVLSANGAKDVTKDATKKGVTAKVGRVLAGLVQSEGDKAMEADIVRSGYGFKGTGVKIGVLSDSFNALGGEAGDYKSGDLPFGKVKSLKDYPPGKDEGRAMLQLIYDVAPGAELYFNTSKYGMPDFATGVEQLALNGCKVIVDDVSFYFAPVFQNGLPFQAVDKVHAMGVAYFSSAGNIARQSWSGPFVDSGLTFGGSPVNNFYPSNPHAPPVPKMATTIPILLLNKDACYIVLDWDQPSYSVSPAKPCQSDLDIYIYDDEFSKKTPIDCTTSPDCKGGTDKNVGHYAKEVLMVNVTSILEKHHRPKDESKLFKLMIVHKSGPHASNMQIMIFGGDFTNSLRTNSGTIFGHKNAYGAAAVGAVYSRATPAYEVTDIQLEPFSSSGGVPILFDTKGNRLKNPIIRYRPNFTGPDGASTTFFGEKRKGFPYPLFFGTSASAPHVAAVAGLMLEGNPKLMPKDIFDALQKTAIDMNDKYLWRTKKGFDYASGYGFVNATAAVEYTMNNKGGKRGGKKRTKENKSRI